jgi:hypothetical protein
MSQVAPETKALQDSIFLLKVARARRTPISERLADGPVLFDQCCEIMRGGIRSEHPEFTDEQVEREVGRRLAIGKKIDDGDFYRDAGVIDE